MVTNDPVSISCGTAPSVRTSDLSADVVEQTLEETFTQVHITDGVNWLCEVNTARKLAVAVAPVVFNTL